MSCRHNKSSWDEWYACTKCFELVNKKELDALRLVAEAAEKQDNRWILERDIETLRRALKFYADEKSWTEELFSWDGPRLKDGETISHDELFKLKIDLDRGAIAKEALAETDPTGRRGDE